MGEEDVATVKAGARAGPCSWAGLASVSGITSVVHAGTTR
jgi:hypothetical protein